MQNITLNEDREVVMVEMVDHEDANIDVEAEVLAAKINTKSMRDQLREEEEAGAKMDFRCENCQDCAKCRESQYQRARSMKDEREQKLID